MFRFCSSAGDTRCVSFGLRGDIPGQGGFRRLEQARVVSVVQRTRNVSYINGYKSFREAVERINSSGPYRKHFSNGIRESYGGPEPLVVQSSAGYMGQSDTSWNPTSLRSYYRQNQYSSRHLVENSRQTQLDVASSTFQVLRQIIRTAHDRSVRELPECSVTPIQQSVLGSVIRGRHCVGTDELAIRKQFCESPVLFNSSSFRGDKNTESLLNDICANVEGSILVSSNPEFDNHTAFTHSEQSKRILSNGSNPGTVPEPEMDNLCLESLWRENLKSKGWSDDSARRMQYCLAKSTVSSYNKVIGRYAEFCKSLGFQFSPKSIAVLAEFLRETSDSSNRLNYLLRPTIAASGHLYDLTVISGIGNCSEIRLLVVGLVKSGTIAPMMRSKVMPIQNFHVLFESWPDNTEFSLRQFRLKTITLLALTLMLRPSDIAPNEQVAVPDRVDQICFSRNQVEVRGKDAKFTFFGINDKRAENGAVFLSLKSPFAPIRASSIAKILLESIKLAGLDGQRVTAKSFRPTWDTSAIEQEVDPQIVRKLGRWKNSEVFYAHYVHANTPLDFTSDLLNYVRS